MQFFILLVGVMVFVFYQFNQSPINFNPAAEEIILNSEYAEAYQDLEQEQSAIFNNKQELINKYVETGNPAWEDEIALANQADIANREAAKLLIQEAADSKKIGRASCRERGKSKGGRA